MKNFVFFVFIVASVFYSHCMEFDINLDLDEQNSDMNSSQIIKQNEYIKFARMETVEENDIETMEEDSKGFLNGRSNNNITNVLSKQEAKNQNTLTVINVGSQSKLLAARNTEAQIYFEVKNLRNEPAYHNFQVVDEQKFLIRLVPYSILLNGGQTTTVIVTAFIRGNTEIGIRDKITLYSQAATIVSQSVYLTVTSTSGTEDTTKPTLRYSYGSRCEGRSSAGTCAGHIWTLEVTAKDDESGLLRVQSQPSEIFYRNDFIAGTKDEVLVAYSASCCLPKVTITAFDVAGNQRSISLDVTDIWLSEAGIAAVVLGVILLIIFIILLVFCIRWCVQKNKKSRELPIYRTERIIERS